MKLEIPRMGHRVTVCPDGVTAAAALEKGLDKAGFEVRALLGDYHGGPWDDRAEVWVILATRRA